ncbi:protein kinase domain-containing protein [Colletotrichum sojae]|uniref:EKC/KEOPS complex subunit BUD32 n=1 Tax=Colletotrichum sojae TaxID=2175907 RepID=A0A8H6IVY1_9PEZI|nr:protein kinase domain-containing protein [Colletotrichum sojae]
MYRASSRHDSIRYEHGVMGSRQPPDGVKSPPPEHVWRLLTVWWDDFLEALRGYRPGRHHPIHLQEELCDGWYRVIHKLGYGGHSTILVADDGEDGSPYLRLSASLGGDHMRDIPAAQRLCFPREHFVSDSCNGRHLCLVYPVLGPTVDFRIKFDREEGKNEFQDVAQQIVETLALLHSRKICHGDFRPSNILLGLESLDGLEVEEVFARLGKPCTSKFTIQPSRSWKPLESTPHAPKYLVLPVDFSRADKDLVNDPSVHVIDSGESFDVSQPPPARFGIPIDYAAPEVVFDKSGATAMDLWALGCTLYSIRLGQQLFNGEKCEHPRYQLISEDEAVDLADLLEGLLRYEPEERLSAQEVLKHPRFHTRY